ncbi:MAG TPA: outer membrane beta-barrel protein [Xanthobacteraceae bacterium]
MGWTNGPALFYATGGLAYGQVNTDLSFTEAASSGAASFGSTKSGWTIGGGGEIKLAGNWTAKLEYLYLDLGTVTGASPVTSGIFVGETDTFSSAIRDHIARVGLNYKLGGESVSVRY